MLAAMSPDASPATNIIFFGIIKKPII